MISGRSFRFGPLLKAAINGARSPGEHPALPIPPDAMARASAEAQRAGAGAIHLHARAPDGTESLAAEDIARCVGAVRAVCTVPVGASTGAWIVPDPESRLRQIAAWRIGPDFASVNFHEEGASAVARELLERGIAVEAGLISAEAADAFLASGLARRCLRILLEPQEQDEAAALQMVAAIERVLDQAAGGVPRLLHGTDRTAWPLLRVAGERGYSMRIGLEDTLTLPNGRVARDNAELVAEAAHLLQASVNRRASPR